MPPRAHEQKKNTKLKTPKKKHAPSSFSPPPHPKLTEVARHGQHPENGPRHGLLLLLGQGGIGPVELGRLLVAPRRLGRVARGPRAAPRAFRRVRQRLQLRPQHLLEGPGPREVGEPGDEVLLDGRVLAQDLLNQRVVGEDDVVVGDDRGEVGQAGEAAPAAAGRRPAALRCARRGLERLRAVGEGGGGIVVAAGREGEDPFLDRREEPERGGEVGLEEGARGGGEVALLLLLLLLRGCCGFRSGS